MMKNLANAAKVLAAGGMLLTLTALVSLRYAAGRPRSIDPYDDIAGVTAGANAAIALLVGAAAEALAVITFLVGAAGFAPLRTRSTLYWLIASMTSLAIFIAIMWRILQ